MTVSCCLLLLQFPETKSRLENCYYFIDSVIRFFVGLFTPLFGGANAKRKFAHPVIITKLKKRFVFIFRNSSVYDFRSYTY
jgi:hypothetical protein